MPCLRGMKNPFANSGSPISALTTSAFKNILSGEIETFAELSESCPDCDFTSITEESEQSISVWMYGPGSELREHIQTAFTLNTLSSEATLAPSPSALAGMLQLDENAIGFLPAKSQAHRRVTFLPVLWLR